MDKVSQSLRLQIVRNYLLVVLGLFATIVLIWIVISIFASQKEIELPKGAKVAATPLTPNLETSSLEKIAEKKFFTTGELESFSLNILTTDEFTRQKILIRLTP